MHNPFIKKPALISQHTASKKKAKSRKTSWIGWLPIICLLLYGGIAGTFPPLRSYEAFLIITVASAPLWIAAMFLWPRSIHPASWRNRPWCRYLVLPVCCIFVIATLVLTVNARLDVSPYHLENVAILGKDYSQGRNGVHYYAQLDIPTPSYLPFALDLSMHVPLNKDEYDDLRSETTDAELIYHQGYLHIPWNSSVHILWPQALPNALQHQGTQSHD